MQWLVVVVVLVVVAVAAVVVLATTNLFTEVGGRALIAPGDLRVHLVCQPLASLKVAVVEVSELRLDHFVHELYAPTRWIGGFPIAVVAGGAPRAHSLTSWNLFFLLMPSYWMQLVGGV